MPGYSLLFPPLAGWLGAHAAVALCGSAAAAALVALAELAPPERRAATRWLAASAAVAGMVVGRGPFSLGVALGALAILLAARGRPAAAAAGSLACVAASPVAGLFLCLIAAGWWLGDRGRRLAPAALALPAAAGGIALGALFPEGGAERFVATAFWPLLVLSAAAAWLLPARLRPAAVLYVLLLAAAFAIESPMGHNATRLGVLAGPALLAAAGRGPRLALLGVGAALLYLQWLPAVRAVAESQGDPATEAAFHAPLLGLLAREAAPGDRVEVVMTRNHWEAVHIARHHALARGWERQLDRKIAPLLYDGEPLTAARYEAWLRRERIRWVALPAAPLDYSSRAEARLIATEPGYLRPVLRTASWRVYEVRGIEAAPEVVAAWPTGVRLRFAAPGRVVLNRRWSPYWRVAEGAASVARADDFVAVRAARPGPVRLDAGL